MNEDRLVEELRALGTDLDVPAPDPAEVAVAVLHRIADEAREVQSPASGLVPLVGRRRRRVLAVVAGLLLALALTPPVRAVVAEWFGLGGVVVQPGPSLSSAPPPPGADGDLTVDAARDLVDFDPVIPAELGTPEAVEVSSDGRILTLSWTDGESRLRLDEFDGGLPPAFMKTATLDSTAELLDVGGTPALWFSEPHDLVVLDDDGRARVESARAAGPTLVWQVGEVTMRLEGADLPQAVGVLRSSAASGTG